MRRLLWLYCGILAGQDLCSVAGRVLNEATGDPLREAEVVLRRSPASASPAFTTETDAAGRFDLAGIEPGRYSIEARRNGFVAAEYGARRPGKPGALLSLEAGRRMAGLDLRLKPHAVIAGRVVNDRGEPEMNAMVTLLRPAYLDGKRQLERVADTYANDLGEYRFFGLPAGRYYVAAGTVGRTVSAATFHPSALSENAAQPVVAAWGSVSGATDIRIAIRQTARVRGRIIDRTNALNGPAVVTMSGAGPLPAGRLNPQRVESGGQFDFLGPAGTYWIAAMASTPAGALYAWQLVDLSGGPVDNADLTLLPPAQVRGRVLVEEGAEAKIDFSSLRVSLRLVEAMPPSPIVNRSNPGAAPGLNGAFTVANVNANRYYVTLAGVPERFYVKSIRAGEDEVQERGIDLTKGDPGALLITIGADAASIEGSVKDARNEPAAGVTVVLAPSRGREYRSTITEEGGKFKIAGLRPGDYKLFAWEDVEGGAWLDEEFMKSAEDKGQDITLRGDAARGVEIRLKPAKVTAP
jgi:hypothetical protein